MSDAHVACWPHLEGAGSVLGGRGLGRTHPFPLRVLIFIEAPQYPAHLHRLVALNERVCMCVHVSAPENTRDTQQRDTTASKMETTSVLICRESRSADGKWVKGPLVFVVATNHHTLWSSPRPQQVLLISRSLRPSLLPVSHMALPSSLGQSPPGCEPGKGGLKLTFPSPSVIPISCLNKI